MNEPIVEPTVEAPTLRESFLAAVPEEKRGAFEKYKDDASLVDGVLTAQSMIGKKGDIPPENASPEEVAEFWGKLGAGEIKPGEFAYGEEFGDLAQPLSERHAEVDKQITELFNDALKEARTLPELKDRVLKAYLQSEAEKERQSTIESQALEKEEFAKFAVENGLSVEQASGMIKGVNSRLGFTDETPVDEAYRKLAYAYATATEESSTLKEARLENSSGGIQTQIDAMMLDDDYLRGKGPKHDAAVKKMTELLLKQAELDKKNA